MPGLAIMNLKNKKKGFKNKILNGNGA